MRITVNGRERDVPGATTVGALLERLGFSQGRVVVERNREIVARGDYSGTLLAEGDRLEIVHFVGGG